MIDGDDEPQRYDFETQSGSDFTRYLTLTDADGSARDLTGYTSFTFTIYESYARAIAGDDPLFTLSLSAGISITDAGAGQMTVFIGKSALAAKLSTFALPRAGQRYPHLTWVYDMVSVDNTGMANTETAGDFIVEMQLSA